MYFISRQNVNECVILVGVVGRPTVARKAKTIATTVALKLLTDTAEPFLVVLNATVSRDTGMDVFLACFPHFALTRFGNVKADVPKRHGVGMGVHFTALLDAETTLVEVEIHL